MAETTIMSWNVRFTLDETDTRHAAEVINGENPDIVCMQESRQQRLGAWLLPGRNPNLVTDGSTFYGYLRSVGWASQGPGNGTIHEHHTINAGTSTGTTIVSRIPLSGRAAQDVGQEGSGEWRRIQRALATLPGGPSFFIYNTHVSLFPEEQRVRAREFAEQSLHLPERRIVCGDFNANYTDIARGIPLPPGTPARPGWVQVAPGSTWLDFDHPAGRPTVPGSGAGTNKLDYSFRLQATMGVAWARIVDSKVSDHKAVVARITGV